MQPNDNLFLCMVIRTFSHVPRSSKRNSLESLLTLMSVNFLETSFVYCALWYFKVQSDIFKQRFYSKSKGWEIKRRGKHSYVSFILC